MKNLITKMNRLTCLYKAGHSFNSTLSLLKIVLGCVLFSGLASATRCIDMDGCAYHQRLQFLTLASSSMQQGSPELQQGSTAESSANALSQADLRQLLGDALNVLVSKGFIETPSLMILPRQGRLSPSNVLLNVQGFREALCGRFDIRKPIRWEKLTSGYLANHQEEIITSFPIDRPDRMFTNDFYRISNLRNGVTCMIHSADYTQSVMDSLSENLRQLIQSVRQGLQQINAEGTGPLFRPQDFPLDTLTFDSLLFVIDKCTAGQLFKILPSVLGHIATFYIFTDSGTPLATFSYNLDMLSHILGDDIKFKSICKGEMSIGDIILLLAKHAEVVIPNRNPIAPELAAAEAAGITGGSSSSGSGSGSIIHTGSIIPNTGSSGSSNQ